MPIIYAFDLFSFFFNGFHRSLTKLALFREGPDSTKQRFFLRIQPWTMVVLCEQRYFNVCNHASNLMVGFQPLQSSHGNPARVHIEHHEGAALALDRLFGGEGSTPAIDQKQGSDKCQREFNRVCYW